VLVKDRLSKYAVAFINFYDNKLRIEIVNASDWKDAFGIAFPGYEDSISSDDIESAKQEAFNNDWMFEVVELTND